MAATDILPYYPLTNTGCNDAAKVNADFAALCEDLAANPHNLLSAYHGDTATGTVVRGDLITGQTATPKWTRLALGSNGYFLKSNGTDAAWSAHGLTYSDVGAAASSHAHAATDITSGTLSTDRFSAYSDLVVESKIGTGAAQVAAGDHYHSSLAASDGDPNPALSVDASGNVGIGIAAPETKLHIKAASGASGGFYLTTNDYVSGVSGSGLSIGFGAASGNTYTYLAALSSGFGAWNNLILQSGGGNVGIGKASLEAWASGYTALQIGGNSSIFVDTSEDANKALHICQNSYYDGSWKRLSTDECTHYLQFAGYHAWFADSSGTADAAFAPTERMRLTVDGALQFSDPDVAQGMTDYLPTGCFGQITKISETNGGIDIIGAADTASATAIKLRGFSVSCATTYMEIIAAAKSGTGITDISASEHALRVSNNATALLDIHGNGAIDNFVAGAAKDNFNALTLTNTYNAADMDGTATSILFRQYYYDASTPAAADIASIRVSTTNDWTSANQDAKLEIYLADDYTSPFNCHLALGSDGSICLIDDITSAWSANQKTAFGITYDWQYGKIAYTYNEHGVKIAGYGNDNHQVIQLAGYRENDSSTFYLHRVDCYKHDGAGALTAFADDTKLWGIFNNSTMKVRVDGSGATYIEATKRVACGGGSTGATTTPNGTVTLEINGTSYYLLTAAAA